LFNSQFTQSLRTFQKIEDQILERLKSENLHQEAYLFEQHLKFSKDKAPQLRAELESKLVPARVFYWHRFLWRPKNWTISKDSEGSYYISNQTSVITSSTDVPGWRFINIAKRAFVWTSNGVFGLYFSFDFFVTRVDITGQVSPTTLSTGLMA